MSHNDKGGFFIRLYIFNCGRRPVFIRRVGERNWITGQLTFKGGGDVNQLVPEATMITIDHEILTHELWKLKDLVVIDHNDKKWFVPEKQMHMVYDMSHLGEDAISNIYTKFAKKIMRKEAKMELKDKYIKTMKKLGIQPKI